MSEVKKFSFGKPGGTAVVAPSPASNPAEPAKPGTEVATTPAPTYQPPAFYTGDDETPTEAGDVRFPRLNIVQKSSGAELLKHGFGSLVLKGTEKLIEADKGTVRLVVAGIRPKIWIEKVKFGTEGRIARSIDEVIQQGGTDKWSFSKENAKVNSNRPWFMPCVTLLVLVQKPEHLTDDNFPFVAEGKAYAAALLTVKSTNYEAVFVAIQSEKATGTLRKGGYNSRFIDASIRIQKFAGGEAGVFKLAFAEETPAEVRAFADSTVGK